VLVNDVKLPKELLEKARKNRVNVISTPLGTFKCANMIKLCNYVKLININTTPVCFNTYDSRDDFVEISSKLGHTNYPIINKKNECLGMIRVVDINDFEKKQVILVDHNQKSQTVDDIEEATILEIIDHHNLGTIGTSLPINFRSMPVGCTCTIIYELFQEAKVEIPKDIAGLMLSAIISDTLMFKSPTTTNLDIEVGNKLAKIAGLDVKEYGMKMFKAASSIEGMDVEDVIRADIKTFKFEKSSLAISVITTMDYDVIKAKQDEFIEQLNTMCSIGNYKYALLFVTDIMKNGSYLFYSEGSKELVENAYGITPKEGIYMDGVVSRKKQMLPPLLDVEERR
jgi:manganese-dependent inorganic pyrophosphatase